MVLYFDQDGNGTVDYDEFLVAVRGALNERRFDMVVKAFNILDANGNGIIEVSDMMQTYDASMHPDVVNGLRAPEDVVKGAGDVRGDGKITKDEFLNYYKEVSANIDD